jgi:hypothetical protein
MRSKKHPLALALAVYMLLPHLLLHCSTCYMLTLHHCGWHQRMCVCGHVGAVRGEVGRPYDVQQARCLDLARQAGRQQQATSIRWMCAFRCYQGRGGVPL